MKVKFLGLAAGMMISVFTANVYAACTSQCVAMYNDCIAQTGDEALCGRLYERCLMEGCY